MLPETPPAAAPDWPDGLPPTAADPGTRLRFVLDSLTTSAAHMALAHEVLEEIAHQLGVVAELARLRAAQVAP